MSGHVKILQLNSNLSKLIDSLCFELTVNKPDSNSLSLLEIIEWKNSNEISQQQFKELYVSWLQSKNVQNIFAQRQSKTYPKQDLIQFEGPIKRFFNVNQITKTLQILNALYNQLYIDKKSTQSSICSKGQIIKTIEEVEKLFSILDSNGIINLRLNEIFFLTASLLIIENKPIPGNFYQIKQSMERNMKEMSEIDGSISLRAFKNYFLSRKNKQQIKGLVLVLQEMVNYLSSEKDSSGNKKTSGSSSHILPQILQQSVLKWKSSVRFKNKQKKLQFLKRIFQENQKLVYSFNSSSNSLYQELQKKYGQQLLNCVQFDQEMLDEFLELYQRTFNKYLVLLQKISMHINKNVKGPTPRYIDQSSSQQFLPSPNNFQSSINSIKKKISSHTQLGPSNKTPMKDHTPQKTRKPNHNHDNSAVYKTRTPTHKLYNNEFGSVEKKNNTSGFVVGSGRQTTPTKSIMTEAPPRTYRAAQKKGLQQNSFYDKLFFFRNKRVESYEIVMKRLKNK